MNWYSRYIPSWVFSTSLETRVCLTALEQAPANRQADDPQLAQSTGTEFTERLLDTGIMISHDGRGRVFAIIFVEWLWRSVKYENACLKD